MSALAAQLTVLIPFGLFGFIEAGFDIGFWVVFLDPRQNVFGVQRDALPSADTL